MKFTKVVAALALGAAAMGANASNLVTNGSFESLTGLSTGTLNSRGWDIYGSLQGWTGQTNIELRRTGTAGNASQGSYFVELDTTKNMSMYQDITATGLVTLAFDFMARVNTGATNGLSYSFGSPTQVSVLTNASGGTNPDAWSSYSQTFDFGSTSSTKRLTFYATSTSDSLGASLDNVSVTAVPEVETYAMMLAGLGLMGTIVRRRKSRAA